MEEPRKVNSGDGEIPLPEPVIHRIQSFLSGEQAARTAVVSKSWYNSWLTRPGLDFDAISFNRCRSLKFWEFIEKTIQRYADLNLNINSFNLGFRYSDLMSEVGDLIKKVLKLCVHGSNCKLEFERSPYVLHSKWLRFERFSYVLPSEVLESESIVKLSLIGCKIDRPVDGKVEFSRLKSLSLEDMCIADGLFLDTFPCLEDLSLTCCKCREDLEISSTSLRFITIVEMRAFDGKFNVPNIRKYTFSGPSLPSMNFIKSSSKWESEISKKQLGYDISESWFHFLKTFLEKTNFLKCKVSLSIEYWALECNIYYGDRGLYLSLPEPPKMENLTVYMKLNLFGCDEFLTAIFRTCRPKIITLYWFPKSSMEGKGNNKLIKLLSLRVIRDRNLYCDLRGLSKVDVEIFEEAVYKWRPLDWKALLDGSYLENKRKIRFLFEWP